MNKHWTATQAISDNKTIIEAGRNVNISSAQNHSEEHYQHETKKSGLMGSGGIGFSIGSERNKQDNTQRTTTQVGSTVGSLRGDTTLVAGEKAQVIASSLSSPQGNITVQGQQIDIRSANNSYHHINQTEYEKKGLTVAENVPLVDAIQNTINTAKQIGQSKNDRVNAMATANTAFQGYQTAQQLQQAGKSISDLAKNGHLAQSAKDANISVSITYGEQKNTTKNETQETTASASQVMAGGTVHLNATGAGEKSNLNIIGSDVLGQQGTHLSADNNINIVASEQNHRENSTNRSQGWNAGEEIKELVNNTTPIGETVDKRRPNKTSDGKGRNDPASVYGTKTGGHVIINDVTGEVTQISDKNDKHWIPDSRIKWK